MIAEIRQRFCSQLIWDFCLQEELLETTWKHLAQANRTVPPPLIKERFCMKLARGDYSEALSCISNPDGSDMHNFCESAWLNLLKEKRFPQDTVIQLINTVSMLLKRNESANPVFQNLLLSCKEFCRTRITVADRRLEEVVCTEIWNPNLLMFDAYLAWFERNYFLLLILLCWVYVLHKRIRKCKSIT